MHPIRVPVGTCLCASAGYAKPPTLELTEADRQALTAIVADRNSPHKHNWRAQIVLLPMVAARWDSYAARVQARRRSGDGRSAFWDGRLIRANTYAKKGLRRPFRRSRRLNQTILVRYRYDLPVYCVQSVRQYMQWSLIALARPAENS